VQVDERDRVRAELSERGVDTGIHYPLPVHLQEAYRSLGLSEGALPVTEAAARCCGGFYLCVGFVGGGGVLTGHTPRPPPGVGGGRGVGRHRLEKAL
jgi:hypothetical protein